MSQKQRIMWLYLGITFKIRSLCDQAGETICLTHDGLTEDFGYAIPEHVFEKVSKEMWNTPEGYGDGEAIMMWASLTANFQPRSATGVTLEHAVWKVIYAAGHNVIKTSEGLVDMFGYPLRQDEIKRTFKALGAEEVVRYVSTKNRCLPKWDSIFDAPSAGTPVVKAPKPKIPLTWQEVEFIALLQRRTGVVKKSPYEIEFPEGYLEDPSTTYRPVDVEAAELAERA